MDPINNDNTRRAKIDYVIFDMDGLMIDTEKVYTNVTNDILGEYGREMTWDIKAGLMGKPEREAGTHLLSFFPDIPLTLDGYLSARDEAQDRLWPTVPLLPGVSRLVRHLKTHAIPMAIATGSRRRNYLLKTGHAEVREVFECFDLERNVVCGDPLPDDCGVGDGRNGRKRGIRKGRGKPHPDIFLVAAKECLGRGVGDVSVEVDRVLSDEERKERSKGLVFEDAVPGVQSAKRAGMNVVWVPDSQLLALGLDGIIERPDQVVSSLEHFKPEEWGLPPYDN